MLEHVRLSMEAPAGGSRHKLKLDNFGYIS